MKNKLKKAHEWAKEIKSKYPKVDYKVQLGLCLSALYQDKGGVEMGIEELPQLEGSEKQIAWATDIRSKFVECFSFMDSYFMPVAKERLEELEAKGKGKIIKHTIEFASKQIGVLKEAVLTETRAAWFISNRYLLFNFPEEDVFIFRKYCENADDYRLAVRKKFVEELKESIVAFKFFALSTADLDVLESNEILRVKVESRVNKLYREAKERFTLDLFNNKYKK